MNHHHRKILHAIFAHPTSANIEPRQVFALFEELGAEVAHGGHGQVKVSLNGMTHGFHHANHGLSKDDVGELRQFIRGLGIDPERDYPL